MTLRPPRSTRTATLFPDTTLVRSLAPCDREKRDMVLTSDESVAANRESWNEAAARHRAHAQYAALLAGFTTPGFAVLDDTLTGRLLGLGRSEEHTSELQSLTRT